MDPLHKFVLNQRRDYLKEEVIPVDIYRILEDKAILTSRDVENCKSRDSDENQVDELLNILLNHRSDVFSSFLEALRESHDWVAKAIDADLQQLNSPVGGPQKNELIKFLTKQPDVVEDWRCLARDLDLEDKIGSINHMIRNDKDQTEAIAEIIKRWIGKKSRAATIGVLIVVLIEMDKSEVADLLNQKFITK